MRGVDGDGLFDEDVLAGAQRELRVLEVVRVRRCNVDYVDGWVRDELGVCAVCAGRGGRADLAEEGRGARC